MEKAEALIQDSPTDETTAPSPEPEQVADDAIAQAPLAASATAPSLQVQAVRWNWTSFGKCTAKELGVKVAQEIVKAFAEPKVRKALKSKQYKKASSIAFNILKKTSPKIAKFIIKRAANAALPGGVVTFFAIPIGKCAIKELF